jgi:hypothetical protein
MSRTVEIIGSPKDLEFPPVCANCGNATSESFEVAKVFRRAEQSSGSSPGPIVVKRVIVPFCPPCTAQHQSEVQTMTGSERFRLALRARSALGVPVFAVLALLVLYVASRRASPSPILFGLAALFAFLAWASYRAAYRETEYRAVPPATSVTSAFDFTDDPSKLFERERHTLKLRNPVFAEALVARNTERIRTS